MSSSDEGYEIEELLLPSPPLRLPVLLLRFDFLLDLARSACDSVSDVRKTQPGDPFNYLPSLISHGRHETRG